MWRGWVKDASAWREDLGGAQWSLHDTSESLFLHKLPLSPPAVPAQPLRIRHPAVNAAAPPQGSPLSTHHQPHHVSCFLHMGCHTCAEQRVCASVLPLVSSCLGHGTLGSHPSDHAVATMRSPWRPIFSLVLQHIAIVIPGFCLFSAPSASLNGYSGSSSTLRSTGMVPQGVNPDSSPAGQGSLSSSPPAHVLPRPPLDDGG
ncbi:hypothetical protein F5144DRAFT_104931 [Chaetomium tenue]|uniref:Uncharacterized protein n=1 Tax=Chaetomium tenue TaxID=1854479 RepID=A0ACB7PGG9_9PEZI|nr:hypothetical protein F5144DRAFT_104931 [Chaetomium globosum]